MKAFVREFSTLNYIINKSEKILLVAHSNPDSDTVGANLALKKYITSLGKSADIVCLDPIPEYLKELFGSSAALSGDLDVMLYDAVVACDSVERGMHKIFPKLSEDQATVMIDHHPDITMQGDVNILDATRSSVCEIIYRFFIFVNAKITSEMATFLLAGILGDTGGLQHANTSTEVMKIASDLMKRGALLSKIVDVVFANRKITTLKLWGRAFEKAKIDERNGMIVTVITQGDIKECEASLDDIAQVASILNTVPGTKFSLILSQKDEETVKGSLRSEEYKGVDVSLIAHQFGGGGHKLASGFEVKGKIVETESGWKIV